MKFWLDFPSTTVDRILVQPMRNIAPFITQCTTWQKIKRAKVNHVNARRTRFSLNSLYIRFLGSLECSKSSSDALQLWTRKLGWKRFICSFCMQFYLQHHWIMRLSSRTPRTLSIMSFRASQRSVRDDRVQQYVQLENQTIDEQIVPCVVKSASDGMAWTQQAPEQDQTFSQAVQEYSKDPVFWCISKICRIVLRWILKAIINFLRLYPVEYALQTRSDTFSEGNIGHIWGIWTIHSLIALFVWRTWFLFWNLFLFSKSAWYTGLWKQLYGNILSSVKREDTSYEMLCVVLDRPPERKV